jgi:hypothetical protein
MDAVLTVNNMLDGLIDMAASSCCFLFRHTAVHDRRPSWLQFIQVGYSCVINIPCNG